MMTSATLSEARSATNPTIGGEMKRPMRIVVLTQVSPVPGARLGRLSAVRIAPGMSVPTPAPTIPKATIVVIGVVKTRASDSARDQRAEWIGRDGDSELAVGQVESLFDVGKARHDVRERDPVQQEERGDGNSRFPPGFEHRPMMVHGNADRRCVSGGLVQ
jgi:hypothetical protein